MAQDLVLQRLERIQAGAQGAALLLRRLEDDPETHSYSFFAYERDLGQIRVCSAVAALYSAVAVKKAYVFKLHSKKRMYGIILDRVWFCKIISEKHVCGQCFDPGTCLVGSGFLSL